jgi:outer membrane protein assembly factor BamB
MTRRSILAALVAVTALCATPVRAAVGVSPSADDTWGTELADTGKAGRVLTVVASGGLVYLGGDFAAMSPPGSKDPSANVARNHLAALGAGGTTLADWNPDADDEVQALAASQDGRRIYAGGMFHHLGGKPAIRLAAIDAVTGALDPSFTPPRVDGVVRALGLSPDGRVLYVGGDFSQLTGADGTVEDRPHIAALDAVTGSLISWLPPRDAGGRYYGHTGTRDKTRSGGVYAIAPSADGTTVHVGGTFLSFGGRSGLVSLDAATGQPTPWQAKVDRPVFGLTRSRDGHTFYAAAGGTGGLLYAFRPHGPPEGVWQVKTDGDNMAVVETDSTVYLIGHYDNIVQPGSDCYQYCPDGMAREHLSAFDRTGKLADWNPTANTPTGPYAAAADATHLYVVGEFTKIGGIRHVGVAVFAGTP